MTPEREAEIREVVAQFWPVEQAMAAELFAEIDKLRADLAREVVFTNVAIDNMNRAFELPKKLQTRIGNLQDAIRRHRDCRGDDRSQSDFELYKMIE